VTAIPSDKIDLLFEYLLNKRRKYDGNTLLSLAAHLNSPASLQFFLTQ